MNYPQIRIKYGHLLADAIDEPMHAHYAKDEPVSNPEKYERIAQNYREFWQPYEQRILAALCDTLGLEFKANVVDVYVTPWLYAFSDPLVIGIMFDTQEKLVWNLTHELTHRLLMDNTTHDDTKTYDEWVRLFGEHDFVTLIHIPVHALLHKVFIDILQRPDMLKEEVRDAEDYAASWAYVEEHGYQKIVDQLHDLYKP